jgi:hypothetical protein
MTMIDSLHKAKGRAIVGAIVAGTLFALSSPLAAAETAMPNPHSDAFVTVLNCDGGAHAVIAYPAPAARAYEPVRFSWRGATVELAAAGGRYVSRAADLSWQPKGRTGNLVRLSDSAPLLTNCVER